MIKTVIFDMDGVIVDTEPIHKFAYYQHFKELKIEVSHEMFASFKFSISMNFLSIFQQMTRKMHLKKLKITQNQLKLNLNQL
mgnify:CR=1 FL=1